MDENRIIFDEVGNFMGTGRCSPSHQYMIAFGSRMTDGDKYGDRAFVLFYREAALLRRKLVDRIHNARVDDAGTFCLQTFEWPRKVDGETFLFFRRAGEQYASIFATHYPTLLSLEQNGTRILFVTEGKLFFLSVCPTSTIASFDLPRQFHPTDGYADEQTKLIFLSQRGSDYYRFTFSGAFLDHRTWLRDLAADTEGVQIYYAVRDEYCHQEDWTTDQYREAANYISVALDRGIEDSFHLSRSDVLQFLAVLRRRAGDAPAAAKAELSAEESLDGFRVVDRVTNGLDEIIKQGDQSVMRDQIARLSKAENYPRLASYRNYFGRLHKLKGSLYVALGEWDNAIAAFRRALEINPRVGCKKQLKQLEVST